MAILELITGSNNLDSYRAEVTDLRIAFSQEAAYTTNIPSGNRLQSSPLST